MNEYARLLDILKQEEELLQFTEFTNKTALDIGLKLVEKAEQENKAVTVDICRNGHQLFHYAMPGTTPDNDEWIKRKNRLVNRFGHSTYYMYVYYLSLGMTMEEKSFLDPKEFAAFGGGFPILIRNVGPVGTITVSGLPHEEDHKLIVSVLKDYLGL